MIFGLGVAVLASASTFAVTVDAILATVDKEAILRSDLIQEIGPLINDLRATYSGADLEREIERASQEALERAIENRILYREAIAAGAKLEDAQVEERIERIRSQYPSAEEFNKALESAGETMSDFRERVRKQVIAMSYAAVKRREFQREAVITETDIAQYYQDHQSEWDRPERVKVRRIFLDVAQDAEARATATARLEALREELELGANFAELAAEHSKGPEAAQGGLVGWVSRGDFVAALDEALFALPEGGVSGVLNTEFGVVLLKAEEKEEAGQADLQEMRTEIEPLLRDQYALKRFDGWIKELRKKSLVQVFD